MLFRQPPVRFALLVWACSAWLSAQTPLLLREPGVVAAQSELGSSPVSLTPLPKSSDVSVVVLQATINADDLAKLQHALAGSFSPSYLKTHTVRLLAVAPDGIRASEPIGTVAQLRSAAAELGVSASGANVDLLGEFDTVSKALPHSWGHVVVVGRLAGMASNDPIAGPWIAASFLRAQCRVTFWNLDGGTAPGWAQAVAASTLEPLPSGEFPALLASLDEVSGPVYAATWDSKLAAGAWLFEVDLQDGSGHRVAPVRAWMSATRYEPAAGYLAARGKGDPEKVLTLNPADLDALRALQRWSAVVGIAPRDGAAWAALAKQQLDAGKIEDAEGSLEHVSELAADTADTLGMAAELRLRKGNAVDALRLLDRALQLDAKRRDLWLRRADCAMELKRPALEGDSLEHARALGELPVNVESRLIRQELAANRVDVARAHLQEDLPRLPKDAKVLSQYAALLVQVKQVDDASRLYQQALETDERSESAYAGLASLYLSSNHAAEALKVADSGLAQKPGSSELLLTKEAALEMLGDRYAARRLLRSAAAAAGDTELLTRWARLEDERGAHGAEAYRALAVALRKENAPEAAVVQASERGLIDALRDGRMEEAAAFGKDLAAAHNALGTVLLQQKAPEAGSTVEIPGGVDALTFIVLGMAKGNANRFFVDYAKALNAMAPNASPASKQGWQELGGKIREYFERVQALAALGRRKGSVIEIPLSMETKHDRQRTEKIFDLLGLKLKRRENAMSVSNAEGKSQIRKQTTLAALAVDDGAIEEAFSKHQTYVIELAMDRVPIYPSEDLWKKAFLGKATYPGGLAQAFATDVRMPRIYLALNAMDRPVAESLLRRFTIYDLADRYSGLLAAYAGAFAMNGAHAEVPGGVTAEVAWGDLAGVAPSDPASFFQSLLKGDEGTLAGFFYTLMQLDGAHQRFFTRSPARLQRFYELFRDSSEVRTTTADHRAYVTSFSEFLRAVPLDESGRVEFPGSPEVWMVAKGRNVSQAKVAKMGKRVRTKAAPDDEDAILIRLAQTSYKAQSRQESELANFIAVSRIDSMRNEPLDEESALLLAQAYPTHRAVYPLLSELGDLSAADYALVFSLAAKSDSMNALQANTYMGELNSILELCALSGESGLAEPERVVAIERKALGRLDASKDAASRMSAVLDAAVEIAGLADPKSQSVDAAFNALLNGSDVKRTAEYRKVFELQKSPSLDALLRIRKALRALPGDASGLAGAEHDLQAIPVVLPAKDQTTEGAAQKHNLERYQTAEAVKAMAKLRQAAQKKKANPKHLEGMAEEIAALLEPWAQLAVTAPIYARFLHPSDALVADDPLLMRKHEFVRVGPKSVKEPPFRTTEFQVASHGEGSRFVGGLAEFRAAAGIARASGNHLGGVNGTWVAASLLASVQATDWRALRAADMESFGASVRLAREWIVESALSADLSRALEVATQGLLSVTRRRLLLDAIARRDWTAAWEAVSISDLHFLGDELASAGSAKIWEAFPVLSSLRNAAQHATEFDALGPVAPYLNGCARPRLARYEPYEEFERNAYPQPLAERLAELKQYVAWIADGSAWPVEQLPEMTAAAAESVASKIQMRDMYDWSSALETYRSLRAEDLNLDGRH